MLVLTRKLGEKVQIGTDVVLTVVKLTNGSVRIGIKAPANVAITRTELQKEAEA